MKKKKKEEWNTGTDQKRDSGGVHGILFSLQIFQGKMLWRESTGESQVRSYPGKCLRKKMNGHR